jgi:hypothetical protein
METNFLDAHERGGFDLVVQAGCQSNDVFLVHRQWKGMIMGDPLFSLNLILLSLIL